MGNIKFVIRHSNYSSFTKTASAHSPADLVIPAARQPILRSKLNLNAYLLMVWQVAADGRSLKLRWKLRLPDNGTLPPAELLELEDILTGMGSQVAEQQITSLGLGKWAEAAGAGVKKIADLLERKMRGEDVLVGEVILEKIKFKNECNYLAAAFGGC